MTKVIQKLMDENDGYWGEHAQFPLADWQYQIASGDTRQGYWEWVADQIEAQND